MKISAGDPVFVPCVKLQLKRFTSEQKVYFFFYFLFFYI